MVRNRRKSVWGALLGTASLLAIVAVVEGEDRSGSAGVVGDYAEARTCDVWTGPCFANGEMNLRGDHAVVAWSIDKGVWEGTRLDGLRIVASLDAEGTFGTQVVGKIRAVVFIDEKASKKQATALLDLAKSLAPELLQDAEIVKVRHEAIQFERSGLHASLKVGKSREVELATTPLNGHCDKICGNESQFYPALAKVEDVQCAKTVAHAYRGDDLGLQWSSPGARSAIVGRFAIDAHDADPAAASTISDD